MKFQCRESVYVKLKGVLPCLTSLFMVIVSHARAADPIDPTFQLLSILVHIQFVVFKTIGTLKISMKAR